MMSASEAPLARYLTVAGPHSASGAAILVKPSSTRPQHHTSIVGCTHASLYVQYYTIRGDKIHGPVHENRNPTLTEGYSITGGEPKMEHESQ